MLDISPSANAAAEIATLDPARDHERIAFLLTHQMFPISIEKSLEHALFKTYAIPSIARLLERTGEFTKRPQKRYDDTVLILAEIAENGREHPRARTATARLNEIHGRFRISNDDFLYTLSAFVFEPIRFLRFYGPRALTENEAEGWFQSYVSLGQRMNIRDIPPSREAFLSWRVAFEQAHMRFDPANRTVADATMGVLFDMLRVPRPLRGSAQRIAISVMEPHVAAAFGYPSPGPIARTVAASGLCLRKALLRILPVRRKLRLQTRRGLPSYIAGYDIEALGPAPRSTSSTLGG